MSLKKIILSSSLLTNIAMMLRKLSLKQKKQIKYGKGAFIGFSVVCEGKNKFGIKSSITSSSIGYASYIGNNTNFAKTQIGRYSSIGPNVSCIFGRHPSDTFVSTHPAFFSKKHPIALSYVNQQTFEEYPKPNDKEGKYTISIGNDVWIGANVSILDGVSIGDGAIVAANALVHKDVAPYTIVGGVPAKVIKTRFDHEEIEFLINLKWWDKPQEWLKKNGNLFNNIKEFKKKIEHE